MFRPLPVATAALLTMLLGLPAGAQTPISPPETLIPAWYECAQGIAFPGPSGEIYGPTNINAQSANGGMSVAISRTGTITVLRWPRPSYYDQVKHRTNSRDEPWYGALENEGAFLGISDGTATTWLRDLPVTQRYVSDWSDTIETTYVDADRALWITVRDVVPADRDAFVREILVEQTGPDAPDAVDVVAYENMSLAVQRLPYFPVLDWCGDELNVDSATYLAGADAIVHERTDVDPANGQQVSAAIAMGFDRPSTQHQVGGDAFEGTALPAGRPPLPTQDAYLDAADGVLSGNGSYTGQTTGALTTGLDLSDGSDTVTLTFTGAATAVEATAILEEVHAVGAPALQAQKRAWFDELLADAPMPGTHDAEVLALARRAVVTMMSIYDEGSGALVASIATQSPYGEDWPRDGAFFNHALDVIGHHDRVETRNLWYAQLQSKGVPEPSVADVSQTAFVPAGNWAMNYYADGVVGGPIPWEIDETGYMLWTWWDHANLTGDVDSLRDLWPSIVLSADFLTTCVDPTNGLQCTAIEDDNPVPSQSIHGAGPVWLGLDSAVKAARALGEEQAAARWGARRDELGEAIDANLYADGTYANGNGVIVWPVCLRDYDDPRFADQHYEAIWNRLSRTFAEPEAGEKVRGLYESKGLLALAKATRDLPGWNERVRSGLTWVATEHAEHDTHIMGEEWLLKDGDIVSGVSQPHVWEQILFYLAALEAWPPAGVAVDGVRDCAGVTGRVSAAEDDETGDGGVLADGAPLPTTGNGLAALGVATLAVGLAWRNRRTRVQVH